MPDPDESVSGFSEGDEADASEQGGEAVTAESIDAALPDRGETAGEADVAPDVAVDAGPGPADDVLLEAVDLARSALLEFTPAETVGAPVGHKVEGEHVLSLLFECTMAGYPGWNWTVTLSRLPGDGTPAVLETELLPGSGALLAPEWVPWSDRLSDYQAVQELVAEEASDDELDDDESDDELDDDELDDDELDDDELDEDSLDEVLDDVLDDALDDEALEEALSTPELDPEEPAESEDEPDASAPQPPAEAGGDEISGEDQQDDESH